MNMSHWLCFFIALYLNLIPTLSIGYWTSWHGTASYDTESELSTVDGYHISTACCSYGSLVDSVQVDFNDGASSATYGGSGGNGPYCWSLATNGGLDQNNHCFSSIFAGIGDSVDFMRWSTSDGQTTPICGALAGPRHNITGNQGECITKLAVRYTTVLKQIRVYFDSDTTPTMSPTPSPTSFPTPAPTQNPTSLPTSTPSHFPTLNPTKNPTLNPSSFPTLYPTKNPTLNPTKNPTLNPSYFPTLNPSKSPSKNPTENPTINPLKGPTKNPTLQPTLTPTLTPTFYPSSYPTLNPLNSPTSAPAANPTVPTIVGDSNEVNENEETTSAPGAGAENSKRGNVVLSDEYLLSNWYYVALALVLFLCLICAIVGCYVYYNKKQRRSGNMHKTTNEPNRTIAMEKALSMSMTGNGTSHTNGNETMSNSMVQMTPMHSMITTMGPESGTGDTGDTGESNTNTPQYEERDDELYDEQYRMETAGHTPQGTMMVEQNNEDILNEDDHEYEYYYEEQDEELYGGNTVGSIDENKQIASTPQ